MDNISSSGNEPGPALGPDDTERYRSPVIDSAPPNENENSLHVVSARLVEMQKLLETLYTRISTMEKEANTTRNTVEEQKLVSSSPIPRKDLDLAAKAVHQCGTDMPPKFKGHGDRSSRVFEQELYSLVQLHGWSAAHLYFLLVRCLSTELLRSLRVGLPNPVTEEAVSAEIERIFTTLHDRFGSSNAAAVTEGNIARLKIRPDESISRFIERLERLRIEYDCVHAVPLDDTRLKAILQYALVERRWIAQIISVNRLHASFDTLVDGILQQEALAIERKSVVKPIGASSHKNDRKDQVNHVSKQRQCYRCNAPTCSDARTCAAPRPSNMVGRCHVCGWDKKEGHRCSRDSYSCGRCAGPHSTFICPRDVSAVSDEADLEVLALDYEVCGMQQQKVVKKHRALKTIEVPMSIGANSIRTQALLDTGASISCISAVQFQHLGGRYQELPQAKVTFANQGKSIAYGPTNIRVTLNGSSWVNALFLIVPGLTHPCILGSEILRQCNAVWIFRHDKDTCP